MSNIIILAIILVIGLVVFFMKDKLSNKIISNPRKKEQILQDYEIRLKAILANCKTKEEAIAQKKIFLSEVTNELSRNIYLTPQENKAFIQKLAVM